MSQIKNEIDNLNCTSDPNIASYKIKIEHDFIPQRSENFETETIPKNGIIENENNFEGNNANKLFDVINDSGIKLEIADDPDIVSDNLVISNNCDNVLQKSKIDKHSEDSSIVDDGITPKYTNGVEIINKSKIHIVNPDNQNGSKEQFVCSSAKSFDKPLTLKIKRVSSVKVEDNFENNLNDNSDSFKQEIVPSDQPFALNSRPIVYENHVPVDASVKLEDDLYNHLIGQDVIPSGDRSLKLKIKRVPSGNHVAYETNVKLEDFNSDQFDCGIFNSEPSSPTDKSERYTGAHLTNVDDFNQKSQLDSSKSNTNIDMNPDVIDPKDSYCSLQRSCRSKINLEEDFDDIPTDSSDPDYEPPIPSKSKINWVYPGNGSTSKKLEDNLSCETSKSFKSKTEPAHRRNRDSGGTKKVLKDNNRAELVDSDYKPKVLLKSEVKRVSCKTCGMKFAKFGQLTRHNVVYHSVKPFKCEICDKRFLWVTDLAIHNRVHSGEKPYTCEICDKSFAFKSTFTIHKRAHSGEKPYTCNVCDKRFVCTSDMNRHKRIHLGTMPYKCDVCQKKFRFSGNFSKHKRTHEEH